MSGRFIKSLAFCSFLVVQQLSLAEVPDELLETPLALAFGAPPTIGDAMLAPDGSRLLFMQQNPEGVSILRSLDIADGEISTLLQGTVGGYDILWCTFANETRVLCDLRQDIFERNPEHQQIVAVNVDGTELQTMRKLDANSTRREGVEPQSTNCRGGYDHLRDDPPVDRLPDDPDQVLFLCEGKAIVLHLYNKAITEISGAGELGSRSRGSAIWRRIPVIGGFQFLGSVPASPGTLRRPQRLVSNGKGFAAIYRGTQNFIDHWFIRDDVESLWQPLLETDPLAFATPFRPVGYGTNLDRIFNIGWNAESETWTLFRQSLTGARENERVFVHGAVDVELVDTMGRDNRVVAAAFLDGRSRRAIVDARVAEVYEYVSGLLPALEIEIVDESWDQTIYLARARAPNSSGEFLLVDTANESVRSLGPEYDHLSGYSLAETRLIEIESSTGGPITAHLTLPHTVEWPEPAAPVPAVIIPRGKPSHEDVADPHYLVQFLAANGYAVLRVNDRVDDAYGRGWLPDRALVGWRQSADDLQDAVDFLIDTGVSEPGLVCGAGKDYGAFTALMTAIQYPELFSCVISIAGVTNPREMPIAELIEAGATGAGDVSPDQASPVRRADELNVPLLMFHGASDTDVNLFEHAEPLASRLEREDKDVVFIEYPQANHEIGRGPDRIDMLARIGGFLAEHIGPPLNESENAVDAGAWRP